MIFLKLFWEFFKVSSFTFGGAYGAIPLIRDMVLTNGWLSDQRLSYMIAVSESTPGPIMVNLATYIGSDQAGFWGAAVATFAVVLPAFLAILLVTGLLRSIIRHPAVQAVLGGLTPCVVGIVAATGLCMTAENLFPGPGISWQAVAVAGALTGAIVLWPKIRGKKLSPITLILLSALLGILFF